MYWKRGRTSRKASSQAGGGGREVAGCGLAGARSSAGTAALSRSKAGVLGWVGMDLVTSIRAAYVDPTATSSPGPRVG